MRVGGKHSASDFTLSKSPVLIGLIDTFSVKQKLNPQVTHIDIINEQQVMQND